MHMTFASEVVHSSRDLSSDQYQVLRCKNLKEEEDEEDKMGENNSYKLSGKKFMT